MIIILGIAWVLAGILCFLVLFMLAALVVHKWKEDPTSVILSLIIVLGLISVAILVNHYL